jgi:hypothetical protein
MVLLGLKIRSLMKLQILPAKTGITWVKLGVKTFFKQPLALGGLFFMFMAATSFLSVIPVAGTVMALAIIPAATLGLMVAALEALRGKFPMPSVLLTAFKADKQRVRAMLTLGVMYATCFLGIVLLINAIDGGTLEQLDLSSPEKTRAVMDNPDFQNALLVGISLYGLLSVLFWHAPGLVHWYGISPTKAIFFSVVACVRNLGAYVMYGLTWMALLMGASVVLAVVLGAFGLASLGRPILMAFALSMAAMLSTSVYFTFRDSFVHTEETPAELHPPAT